jgi:hypothetical protein
LLGEHEVLDLDDEGTASLALPKNSRHTVRVCAGMRCTTQRALVIRPSAFLLHAGQAGEELVGHVLAQAFLAEGAAGNVQALGAHRGLAVRLEVLQLEAGHLGVVDLAQVVVHG